jgi:hypothetical protein
VYRAKDSGFLGELLKPSELLEERLEPISTTDNDELNVKAVVLVEPICVPLTNKALSPDLYAIAIFVFWLFCITFPTGEIVTAFIALALSLK